MTATQTRSRKTRKTPPTDAQRAEWAAKKTARRQQAKDLMESAFDALSDPETWEQFLSRPGQLMKMNGEPYSFRNQLLIYMQNPEATDVSGFRGWLDRGRQVRKGETGMIIYGPRKVIMVEGPNGPEQRKASEVQDGQDRTEKMAGVVIETVFAITQTDPIEGKTFKPAPNPRRASMDELAEMISEVGGEQADAILEAMQAATEQDGDEDQD